MSRATPDGAETASEDRFEVSEDAASSRFLLSRDSEMVGFADYCRRDGVVTISYVETLARYRGQGFGDRLMDGVLEIIRADGERVRPVCSFAVDHMARNPAQRDLLA